MRKGLRIVGLLFAFTALACAAAAQAQPEETAAPEEYAVVVGDVRFSKELVQFTLTNLIDAFAAGGETLTEEDAQALLDETIEHYVQLGVVDSKLKDNDQYDFSEEDLEYYRDYARQTYEQVWQGVCEQMRAQYGDSVSEEQVSDWLNQLGYTVDMFYDNTVASARMSRAMALYCPDATVTTQEVAEYYLKNFVEPDRDRYEHDVPRYEKEVLLPGGEAFFVPEGYRYIKHILLPFPDELQQEIDALLARIEKGQALEKQAYDALAEAAASGEDIAPYKADYDARGEALTEMGREYDALLQRAVPMLEDKTDEIYRRYRAGEAFETLMVDYSTDRAYQTAEEPGYLFHPQSEIWAGDFSRAAAALQKPGDVSDPVVTTEGVHIIRYMADAPGGIHKLTAQEQQALEASARQAKQLDALGKLIEEWQADYEIETHPEMLRCDLPVWDE